MDSRAGELVGFLCRWALLALVAAVVLVVAAANFRAVSEFNRELSARFLAIDSLDIISQPNRSVEGLVTPPVGIANSSLVMGNASTGRLMIAWGTGNRFWLVVNDDLGAQTVWLKGCPHGEYAYQERPAALVVLPRGQPIIVLDERLLDSGADSSDEDVKAACALADRRPTGVAILYIGTASDYEGRRGTLDAWGIHLPLVCDPGDMATPLAGLKHVCSRVEARAADVRLVSGDEGLLREASRQGFAVEAIGAAGKGVGPDHRHASLTEFVRQMN